MLHIPAGDFHDGGFATDVSTNQAMAIAVAEFDTVARIGGDEFVILLPSIETARDAVLVAEKIREAIDRVFVLSGEELDMW